MANKETKTITIDLRIPASVELEVQWNPEEECTDIKAVWFSQIQRRLSPSDVYEQLDEDGLQLLDEQTLKAFGGMQEKS